MTERDTSSNAACAITVLRVPVGRAAGSVGTPMDRSVAPGSPRERCRRRVARGVRACRRTPHGGGWLPRPFRSDRGAWAHAEARRSSAPRAVTPSSPPVTHRRGHNSGPLPVVPVLIRRHRPERLDNPCRSFISDLVSEVAAPGVGLSVARRIVVAGRGAPAPRRRIGAHPLRRRRAAASRPASRRFAARMRAARGWAGSASPRPRRAAPYRRVTVLGSPRPEVRPQGHRAQRRTAREMCRDLALATLGRAESCSRAGRRLASWVRGGLWRGRALSGSTHWIRSVSAVYSRSSQHAHRNLGDPCGGNDRRPGGG
jgi:hypothetical protein